MFESAELGHKIDKEEYDKAVPELRAGLLDAQYELLEKKNAAVIVLVGGVDGAGKGATVNLLNEWMDPRHIHTHAMSVASDEEVARPPFYRFFRRLPPKGKLGVFFGSWYTDAIVSRAYGKIGQAQLDQRLEAILRFERMLTSEGVLLIKLWFHLSKEAQKRRLKELAKDKLTAWRVTPSDWHHFKLYDKFRRISARALRHTGTANAPWVIVEGADARYRALTVGRVLLHELRHRLSLGNGEKGPPTIPPPMPPIDELYLLEKLDLSVSTPRKTYEKRYAELQRKLNQLSRDPRFGDMAVMVVFEGSDAAGKGGAIRRITRSLDARQFRVIPIAAPTDEERAQPYLWRFWRNVPGRGKIVIFDRSWYGRVLVERVEGFAATEEWSRAYAEINDFEEQLRDHRILVVKFWLQISQDEQLQRFKDREATSFKRYKLTSDDWRNREKWDDYLRAACDMIDRTSTEVAPWTLVEANDKLYARLKVMETLCSAIEGALGKR